MTVLYWASVIMLTLAALVTLVRMILGPTVLDRALAGDLLVSVVVCALGVEAVVARHSTTLPILITVSLLGFVGTVATARFVGRDVDTRFAEDDQPALPARHAEGGTR